MKKIKALQNYTDTVLNKEVIKGDEYIVDNERAEVIINYRDIKVKTPLAEIIEDVKEEVKEIIEEVKDNNKEVKPKTTIKKKVTKKK